MPPAINRPLTDAQRDQVAQWVPYAYRLAWPYINDNPRHRDEIESAAMLGLMKAAARHDSGRGSFPTIAYRCVRSQINAIFVGMKRMRRDPSREVPMPLDVFRDDPALKAVDDRDEIEHALGRITKADTQTR